MDKKNIALFDPGFAPIVIDSLGQVGYTYYMFNAIGSPKIKKANFPFVLKKLEKFLKTNVAFYLGCMLWASYIKSFKNHEIEGNQLLGEKCDEKEYLDEINFLIDFVKENLIKEYKYYVNKFYKIDNRYLPVLEAYKQFLILNKGFCNCSNTDQIVLPDNLKKLDKDSLMTIKDEINKAIENKNMDLLLDSYDLLF